jgi:hypothetical protein
VQAAGVQEEVERALFQWVQRWQQLSKAGAREEADEQGDLLHPLWGELWQCMYVVWDIFAAPHDTGGTARVGPTEGYGLLQWSFGNTLLDLVTLGLTLQHVITILQPTANSEWDSAARSTLEGAARRVYTAVNQWCREYSVRTDRVACVADLRGAAAGGHQAQGPAKRARVQHPRAGSRYTYNAIRNVLLFMLLALVGLVSGVAGMVPLRQGTSGTFRDHA